tara:strand:+ start:21 stop:560 length:540 start_codon:yes stop_codon:yes gene_type:complete
MKTEKTENNRKLFKFDLSTKKSDILITFIETRDPEKNIGFAVNFGVKCEQSKCTHEFGNMDINVKTNNYEFYKIMTVVFNKIMDFMKDNPKYRFTSFFAKDPTQKEFNIRMATKRWSDIIIKENPKTNEIYFYRDKGVTWKNEILKAITIDEKTDKEVPPSPFDYFQFPSQYKFTKYKN